MVKFALAYGMHHQGYCHLVVASMAVVMFRKLCKYNYASRMRWRNVKFEPDGNNFHPSFERRKNAQFRQGNRVTVEAATHGPICPLKLLHMMMLHTGGLEDAYVFRGFSGRLEKRSPERTSPSLRVMHLLHMDSFLHSYHYGLGGDGNFPYETHIPLWLSIEQHRSGIGGF